ncbi:MAG: hypothetical protein M1837_002775 [Sclerophora amabilis]|nr:MAG: hypothetical protein M1837_002775 [Sclerophora amabilis]
MAVNASTKTHTSNANPETSPSRLPRFGLPRVSSKEGGAAHHALTRTRSLLPQRSPVRPALDETGGKLEGSRPRALVSGDKMELKAGEPPNTETPSREREAEGDHPVEACLPRGDSLEGPRSTSGGASTVAPSSNLRISTMRPPTNTHPRSLRKPSSNVTAKSTGARSEGHRPNRSQDISQRRSPLPSSTNTEVDRDRQPRPATSTLRSSSSRECVDTDRSLGKIHAERQGLEVGGERHSRSAKHGRASSTSVIPQHPKTSSGPQRTPNPSQERGLATDHSMKPTFSTFQQHFTPKKPTKPLARAMSSSSQSPKKPALQEVASSETIRLQTELLQMHLLHQGAASSYHQWEQSARGKIRIQFEETARRHRKLRTVEQEVQERVNLQGLREWLGSDHLLDPGDKIQSLGSTIQEVHNLIDSGGVYHRIVRAFEKWISWIDDIYKQRQNSSSSSGAGGSGSGSGAGAEQLEFIDGLGDGWKSETASLARKLASLSHRMVGLGDPLTGSGLEKILANGKDMVANAMAELELMRTMERELMAKERSWVESQISDLADEVEEDLETMLPSSGDQPRRGIWCHS